MTTLSDTILEDRTYREKLKQITDAWKGIEFPGAELLFNYSEVPEIDADFDWPDDLDYFDLPSEAFTGRMIDKWSIGWKATIGDKKYGYFLCVTDPSVGCEKELRKNYEQTRKYLNEM